MSDEILKFKGHLYARIDESEVQKVDEKIDNDTEKSEKVDVLPMLAKGARALGRALIGNGNTKSDETTEVVDSSEAQRASDAVFAISHAIEKAEQLLKHVAQSTQDSAHKSEIRQALNKLNKMTADVHTIAEILTDFE